MASHKKSSTNGTVQEIPLNCTDGMRDEPWVLATPTGNYNPVYVATGPPVQTNAILMGTTCCFNNGTEVMGNVLLLSLFYILSFRPRGAGTPSVWQTSGAYESPFRKTNPW